MPVSKKPVVKVSDKLKDLLNKAIAVRRELFFPPNDNYNSRFPPCL